MTTDDLAAAMQSFDDAIQQRDRLTAEGVLDEDFALILVHPAPAEMPRARWLDVLQDYHVHSYSVAAQRVDESDGWQQSSPRSTCAPPSWAKTAVGVSSSATSGASETALGGSGVVTPPH
jgi:hypothetical protein